MSLFVRYQPLALGGGGGGATLTMGAFDGQSGAATGASIVGSILYMQSATASVPGSVNISTQTFAGQKTFSTGLTGTLTGHATLDVATSSLGNLTDAGTDGIVVTGGTGAVVGNVSLAQQVSDSTHNGYLSSTDWVSFDSKQPAGSYITALTGDATAAGPGSATLTLATVNGNVGSFTLSNITVNAKGLVTAASSTATGDLTDAGTDGIVITGGTGAVIGAGTSIAQHVADSTHNGYLSSTDWSTFNNKQATVSIGSFNNTSTANGLDITAAVLTLHAADGTNPGAVSTTTQTFAGNKTFTGTIAASNLSGTNTGDVTLAAFGSTPNASGASLSGQVLTLQPADGTNPGGVSTGAQTIAGQKTFSSAPILSSLTASQAVVTDGSKVLASLAYASANTASALVQRDGSGNFSAGTITAALTGTASGNTTISGQTNHGVVVASATNAMTSTGAGTSGQALVSGGASADPAYGAVGSNGVSTATFTAPTQQRFASGTAQTYTTPTSPRSPLYIRVRMVAGGGGGGGSGTTAGTAATDGTDTVFGTSLLTANGGVKGARGADAGAGGSYTLNSPAMGSAFPGGAGGGGASQATSPLTAIPGGIGGVSAFGGGGFGGGGTTGAGGNGTTNSGSGGGGAYMGSVTNGQSGSGGGAGGFIDALILSPSATYTYTVGTGGTGQTAGGTGFAGGNGAAGYIEVTEYYQ